jgi:hypothetical protein
VHVKAAFTGAATERPPAEGSHQRIQRAALQRMPDIDAIATRAAELFVGWQKEFLTVESLPPAAGNAMTVEYYP